MGKTDPTLTFILADALRYILLLVIFPMALAHRGIMVASILALLGTIGLAISSELIITALHEQQVTL